MRVKIDRGSVRHLVKKILTQMRFGRGAGVSTDGDVVINGRVVWGIVTLSRNDLFYAQLREPEEDQGATWDEYLHIWVPFTPRDDDQTVKRYTDNIVRGLEKLFARMN